MHLNSFPYSTLCPFTCMSEQTFLTEVRSLVSEELQTNPRYLLLSCNSFKYRLQSSMVLVNFLQPTATVSPLRSFESLHTLQVDLQFLLLEKNGTDIAFLFCISKFSLFDILCCLRPIVFLNMQFNLEFDRYKTFNLLRS